MKRILYLWALWLVPSGAFAQSNHAYVNTMRSSTVSHLFFSQGIEGEVDDIQQGGDFSASQPGSTAAATGTTKSKWHGYLLSSTIGLEVMKFIQFNMSYGSLNLRSTNNGLEKLGGSRFMAGTRFVFLAPIANLEAGGGLIGSRYDYQHNLETGDFYGSGYYYSLGMNYFMSEQVSFFGTAKMLFEHAVRNGGEAETKSIDTQGSNLGLGFTLWI